MTQAWSTVERGLSLKAALTAAAQAHDDAGALRDAALALFRAHLESARAEAERRLDAGGDGLAAGGFLSDEADALIGALWAFTTVHVVRARNPTAGERMAVLATGGYGRGSLAPFSDVDLLFLRAWKPTPFVESATEFMLYLLWDLGLKVGWASRTVDDCLKAAREDVNTRTSLLDARLIDGDPALAEELKRRFRREVVKGSAAEFVAAKLMERDERHLKAGASRYMVEPDVKNGKGGLRDLHTLMWLARWMDPEPDARAWTSVERMLSDEQARRLHAALRFLWTVRFRLHLAAGRAEERLSFHWQPEVAEKMGYAARRGRPPAERLMRRYFLTVREAGFLTRIVCAELEARAAKAPPLSRLLERSFFRRRAPERGLRVRGGRLGFKHREADEREPVDLLRLFRAADTADLDLHPEALEAVRRDVRLMTPEARADPEAAEVFLDVLTRGRDPERALTLMNDTGLLGRFIPEWGRIVARTQFNMYHAWTVDEHTLRAVGVVARIARGEEAERHPLATELFPTLKRREAVYLAMLLHDVGKADPGEAQEVAGARAARAACERLGVDEDTIEEVVWLVGHHLLMSDTAQKRDLADPETARTFARQVGSIERLKGLLVVTVADIRAVAPGVWNGWKGQLIRELYQATAPLLTDQAEAEETELFTPNELALQARLREQAMRDGAAAHAQTRKDGTATELTVAAKDRLGLFADVAATLAAEGASVVGARAATEDGMAVDVFYLHNGSGEPWCAGRPELLARLADRVRRSASGETAPKPKRRRTRAEATFDVTATVSLDDFSSPRGVIVEMSGADRPGLLADLARAVADTGLSIASAHVETAGERAVDVFYVTEADGSPVKRPGTLSLLKAALLEVLGETATERPAA